MASDEAQLAGYDALSGHSDTHAAAGQPGSKAAGAVASIAKKGPARIGSPPRPAAANLTYSPPGPVAEGVVEGAGPAQAADAVGRVGLDVEAVPINLPSPAAVGLPMPPIAVHTGADERSGPLPLRPSLAGAAQGYPVHVNELYGLASGANTPGPGAESASHPITPSSGPSTGSDDAKVIAVKAAAPASTLPLPLTSIGSGNAFAAGAGGGVQSPAGAAHTPNSIAPNGSLRRGGSKRITVLEMLEVGDTLSPLAK